MAQRNEIEILIRARDEATRALNEVNQKIRQIEGSAGGASTGMADLSGRMSHTERQAMRLTHGWQAMAKGMLAARVIMEGFNLAYEATIGLMIRGVKSIDDLRQSQASMAAAFATTDPSISFDKAYKIAGAMVEKVQELDRAFIGTADELMILVDSMATFGAGIDLSTKKSQDQFVAFGNLIKMMTKGQDFQRQAYQEIRALMEGANVQGAMLVKKLEAQGVNVKVMIPLWREQGTLIENIISRLPGYAEASGKIENTLQAQKSSLETITNKILREGMAPAYEDIVGIVKRINDALLDQVGLTEKAHSIAQLLAYSWDVIYLTVKNTGEALRNLIAPLTELLGVSGGLTKNIIEGWSYILAILPPITDRIGEMLAGVLESVKMVANLGAMLGHILVLDFDGMTEHFNAAMKNWEESGKRTGKSLRSGLLDEIESGLREVDSRLKREKLELKIDVVGELKTRGAVAGETEEQKNARESIEKYTEKIKGLISKYQLEVKNLSETGGDEIDRMLASNHQKWSERLRALADDKNWEAVPAAMRNMLTSLLLEGERLDNVIDLEKKRDSAIEALRKKAAKRDEDELKRIADGVMRQEELRLRLIALREEAETPVKWPWNEPEVERLEKISEATARFSEQLRSLNKEFEKSERGEGPLMTQEQYDRAAKAYQDVYGATLRKISEETDVTLKSVAAAWDQLYNDLGGQMSDVFFDAFKGKLDSLGDYMEAFTDIVRRVWANLISDMITEQLRLSFGDALKSGLSSFAGGLGGLFGGFSGGAGPTDAISALDAFYTAKEGAVFPGPFRPIRAFAEGGIIDRPTFGLIGEGGGPEAVIPLKGGKVPVEVRGGDRGAINVNMNIIAADTKDFDRLLMDRRSLIMGMFGDAMRNASGMRDVVKRSM